MSNDMIKYLKFEWKDRKRTGDFPGQFGDDVNDVLQQVSVCDCGVFT